MSEAIAFHHAKQQMAAQIKAAQPCAPITRIEIKIKPIDQLVWLEAQKSAIKIYGANQDHSYAIAGIGEAAAVQGAAGGQATDVFVQLRKFLSPQYPYLQWYGGFCFDEAYLDSAWKPFGAYRFVIPRFELAAKTGKMIFCCNLTAGVDIKAVLKQLEAIQLPKSSKAGHLTLKGRRDQPSLGKWKGNVVQVLNAIAQRQYHKVVLARKTVLRFEKALNPWQMLGALQKVTPNSYHFCFQFGANTFLGASPERLYRRKGKLIQSEAVAGTMPRGKTKAADQQFRNALTHSAKNKHEHRFVVDAIQAHLQSLCGRLRFDAHPSVISLGNGHHLISRFEGELKAGIKDEDVLQCLHPTPAVGGAPRRQALAVIRGSEPFSRGWYAGPLGYVGLDWAEFVVGIRSALVQGRKLSIFAGAGIVQGSDPQAEWDEIEHKIGNFLKIIQ